MSAKKLSISKVASAILLLIIAYLVVINTFNYFTVGSFASPLLPKNSFEEISKLYLQFSITSALCLIIAFFFHKRGKYFISIGLTTAVFVLLNYFPELFGKK